MRATPREIERIRSTRLNGFTPMNPSDSRIPVSSSKSTVDDPVPVTFVGSKFCDTGNKRI